MKFEKHNQMDIDVDAFASEEYETKFEGLRFLTESNESLLFQNIKKHTSLPTV